MKTSMRQQLSTHRVGYDDLDDWESAHNQIKLLSSDASKKKKNIVVKWLIGAEQLNIGRGFSSASPFSLSDLDHILLDALVASQVKGWT